MSNHLKRLLRKNQFVFQKLKNIRNKTYEVRNFFVKKFRNTDNIGVFELDKLKHRKCQLYYPITENELYGNYFNLDKYFNLDFDKDLLIEHTFYLPDSYKNEGFKNRYQNRNLDYIIRMKTYKNIHDNIVIDIGPYINYINSFYSKSKLSKLKKKLGKTLVVFPSHSMADNDNNLLCSNKFDKGKLVEEIDKLKQNHSIDNVLICLYYLDLTKENISYYEKNGFVVVSAGSKFDVNFINRLKSIILLSDFTMSNKIGTYIPYSLTLNKPHYIFKQKLNYKGSNDELENQKGIFVKSDQDTNIKKIVNMFSEFVPEITNRQRKFSNKLWGIDIFRDKDYIFKLIKNK